MSFATKNHIQSLEVVEPEFTWPAGEPCFGNSKRLGKVANATELFDRDKRRTWARIGNLAGFRITANRILIATWIPGEKKTGSILLPDSTADEDKWQGKTGLLVGKGPQAFKSDENRTFLPEEIPMLGDWVLLRRGDGNVLQVWGHECVMVEDTAIRAILDRPDSAY